MSAHIRNLSEINILMSQCKIHIFICFIIIFISPLILIGANNTQPKEEINILSFNTLMAFPDKALSTKNHLKSTLDEDKLTPYEFTRILENLYHNNYQLIDIYDYIKFDDNKPYFSLPKLANKKPLILTFENVTYKSNYQNHGEIDKIIIDRNNQLATYTAKKSIQDRIQYDNEFLVILEDFVESHPDFSFKSARGIIFFSGEDGILGYNTSSKKASSKQESKRAKEVILKLTSLGWKFGSNNYTYSDDNFKSEIEFTKELSLWNKEIKPLLTTTTMYSFPLGNFDNSKTNNLYDNGFNILFYNSFSDYPTINDSVCWIPKKLVSGKTLRNNKVDFSKFFNCEDIYDTNIRTLPLT